MIAQDFVGSGDFPKKCRTNGSGRLRKIFCDSDMRFLTVIDLDMETRTAWAGGLEIFMNTGENDALGAGSIAL